MDAFCEHGHLKTRCPICSEGNKAFTPLYSRGFNLAFKCNWLDSDYEGPCGKEGRRWNIYVKRFPWCTQPENPCFQYEAGKIKEIPLYPCYETEIFSKSEYGAGVNHSGPMKDRGRKIKHVIPGKLALFTTVEPRKSGDTRYIFGFFVIKDDYEDGDGATKIVGYPEYTLKIPKDSRLRFWDFYSNSDGSTFWGTGLFRYLSDEVVVNYLTKQREVLIENGHTKEAEVVERILEEFLS
ncbi:MAG: hypothetical protein XD48_0084 [Archaeoglobus fulgidus]|jgi:hypothetical protein|uniref:Uncharacterized protein n=1 Tax=Archaeoglobus fulgidus TaxID=2234 RepID=A0A117KV70_ARCFL|nr:MAG: hypothetical protein XD48_0084 [Archaeoglobus fulgidus]